MRAALAALALALALPVAARAQTVSLDELAGEIHTRALAADVAAAPERISIDVGLRDTLLQQPLDGGREQMVYLRYDPATTSLSFDRAVAGARYRASGRCADCNYPQPIQGHTHPYDNPFSVTDLDIAASSRTGSLMVSRDGRLWLAVPTAGSYERAMSGWWDFRYALFGNRLQCPARTPPGGWASTTPMARNVEIVARAAAHDLRLALYVLDPGETRFRKLPDFHHGDPIFAHQPFGAADLNAWEMALLRTLALAGETYEAREGPWLDREAQIDPRGDAAPLMAALAAPPDEFDDPEVQAAPRNAGNIMSDASAYWFKPLPTTVYRAPYGDLSRSSLPFVSIQYSADCRDVLVLQGEQTFAPDAVTYSRGWRRSRTAPGAWNEGWSEAPADRWPTGQVVPW